MPIGILGSLGLCTLLYVLVSVVITGILPFDKLNVPDPIAVGVDAMKEATAEINRLWREAELAHLQVASGVRQAIQEYRRSMQLATLARSRRDTGDRTLALAHDRYVNKGGILSDWDLAYRAWLQSEIDYWNVDAEQKNAVIGLFYASGSLETLLQR